MRISDWSSDVCSSDLFDAQLVEHREQQQRLGLAVAIAQRPGRLWRLRHIIAVFHAAIEIADFVLDQAQRGIGAGLRVAGGSGDAVDLGSERPAVPDRAELGRASCRARVWKYV